MCVVGSNVIFLHEKVWKFPDRFGSHSCKKHSIIKEIEKISFKCTFSTEKCVNLLPSATDFWLWLKNITLRDALKFIYSSVCLGWKKMRIEETWNQIYPVYRKLIACIFSIFHDTFLSFPFRVSCLLSSFRILSCCLALQHSLIQEWCWSDFFSKITAFTKHWCNCNDKDHKIFCIIVQSSARVKEVLEESG